MSNKKGFTLVEISIVLVIIGLMAMLAIRGTDIVRAAKIRAELSKVGAFYNIVNIYLNTYGRLPGYGPDQGPILNSDYVINDIVRSDLTTKDIFTVSRNIPLDNPTYWGFARCATNPNNPYGYFITDLNISIGVKNLCLGFTNKQPGNQGSLKNSIARLPYWLGSSYEIYFDDGDYVQGQARLLGSSFREPMEVPRTDIDNSKSMTSDYAINLITL